MSFVIDGNPDGARVFCSSSIEPSLRKSRFWDEKIAPGLMLRLVDLAIEAPGWMKVEQSGINISCMHHGNFASSYFRRGDADARGESLRIFALEGRHHQLVTFTRPTRHRVIQIWLDPDKLSDLASDLDESPDELLRTFHTSCHVQHRFAVANHPLPLAVGRLTASLLEGRQSGFLRRLSLYGQSLEILAQTYELLSAKTTQPVAAGDGVSTALTAAEMMRLEYAGEVKLPDIARRAGVSEDSLLKAFRQHYGVTPSEYLSSIRMAAAEDMLQNTDLPVSEIGRRTGYSNPTAFSRAFRRHFGHSPSEHGTV
ncbi:MAG: helix-turn-helix transcriptional regulator [Pannonibacter phragmitetus]